MEALVKGDVVVLPFPFSDLSNSKKRPAVVAADIRGDDLILCQITSCEKRDEYAIDLCASHFRIGKLKVPSVIRPNRIFTADSSIVLYKVGSLRMTKIKELENALVDIMKH